MPNPSLNGIYYVHPTQDSVPPVTQIPSKMSPPHKTSPPLFPYFPTASTNIDDTVAPHLLTMSVLDNGDQPIVAGVGDSQDSDDLDHDGERVAGLGTTKRLRGDSSFDGDVMDLTQLDDDDDDDDNARRKKQVSDDNDKDENVEETIAPSPQLVSMKVVCLLSL